MLPKSFGWGEIFHETEHFPKLTAWFEHCMKHEEFSRVREEILKHHRADNERGRLSGVKEDVANHPEFQWKYM
jgi:hypothetical protein